MGWEWRHQDRANGRESLRWREVTLAAYSRQRKLDALVQLAYALGVCDAASPMAVSRERDALPSDWLLRTRAVLPCGFATGRVDTWFEDAAIVWPLDSTALQIREGLNDRRGASPSSTSAHARPWHTDVLRPHRARLRPEGIATVRQTCLRDLCWRTLITGRL